MDFVTGSFDSLVSIPWRLVRRVVDLWFAIVGIALYLSYRGIAFTYDRGRERRRAGVLWVAAEDDGRSEPPEPGGELDFVLGYMEHAHTGFHPDFEETQGAAFRLVREGGPDPDYYPDVDAWRKYDLDDPAMRARFLQQVPLGRVLSRTRHCIYCGTLLRRGQTDDLRLRDRGFVWRYETKECTSCGWWCVSYRLEERFFAWDELDYFHAYAVMRRFDPLALDTPLSLARGYLARNPHKLARFDPFHFEALMVDCLRDYFGDGEVHRIGGHNDRGIDIKVVEAGEQTLLVQVKRRGDFSRREGVEAVRSLHGVMLREGVPRGMLITTARAYTREAKREVKDAQESVQGYSMELMSYRDVVDLLGEPPAVGRSPWRAQGIRLDQPPEGWRGGEQWIDRSVLPPTVRQLY